jgi:hypothetical protein
VYKDMMKLVRKAILAVSVLALVVPSGALGKDKDAQPAPPAKPLRVAVMPLMNGTQESLANQVISEALREGLTDLDAKVVTFLLPTDTERILSSQNAFDRAYRVAEKWGHDATLDSSAIVGLDTLLVSDAVLCVKISEWEIKRITVIGAGQSYTTIGLSFALYDIRSKKMLWKKDVREQRLAPEYDVSSGQVSYDETGQIQSRTTNEPPRPKEVAEGLIRSAFKKFPRA